MDLERRFWDLYAKSYSLIPKTYKPYQEVMQELKESICARRQKGQELVLDSGCGVGAHTTMLKNEGFSVIGLDLSDAMIKKAKKTNEGGMYLRGDMQTLPLKDESIHHIVSVNALYTVPEPDKVLSEWNRVLVPGGYLHLVTFAEPLNIKEMSKEYLHKYGVSEYGKMFFTQFLNGLCGMVIQNKMQKGTYHYWNEKIHSAKLKSNNFELEKMYRTYICNYDIHSISRKPN